MPRISSNTALDHILTFKNVPFEMLYKV